MTTILHDTLPYDAFDPRHLRLPGTQPDSPDSWLSVDDRFAAQMALRDRLVAERPEVVLADTGQANVALAELRATVLAQLEATPGYVVGVGQVVRPDGVAVPLDLPTLPLLARLVQEDICLLDKPLGETEHRLMAAAVCFPANWALAEKIGRPLGAIHHPVAPYDADMARRVQRLFDGIAPGWPMYRVNRLPTYLSDLHTPKSEAAPRRDQGPRRPTCGPRGRGCCACPRAGRWSSPSTPTWCVARVRAPNSDRADPGCRMSSERGSTLLIF
ncbi:heme-dependent oxidative N-demethylase subunit alpha family protein [Mesobaculum littorinae]